MGEWGDKRILECGMRNRNKICPYFWVRQRQSFHCFLHKFVGLAIARSHMPEQQPASKRPAYFSREKEGESESLPERLTKCMNYLLKK